MSGEIFIRKAELQDANGIYIIDQFWYKKYIDGDRSNGYLYLKNNYTFPQIEKIVGDGYGTVAIINEQVVSYYFINPYFETGNIAERKIIIQDKIAKGILPEGKYAHSLQAATNEKFTGQGLNKKTLNLLKELSKNDYDYFIGIMSYDNIITQKSSLKMGWRHFGDIGFGILAVTGTTEERNDNLNL